MSTQPEANRRRRSGLSGLLTLLLAALPLFAQAAPAQQSAACSVTYTLSQWQGGFTADVKITNGGPALSSWALTWSFPGDQRVTGYWNADIVQTGSGVTARNLSYNASLPTGGSQSFGFQATFSGTNSTPTNFALNGQPCNGGPSPTATSVPGSTPTATRPPTTATPTRTPASPTPTTPPVNTDGLVGFAAVSGMGLSTTTGGAGGSTVTVTNASGFLAAIGSSSPLIIRVNGTISLSGMNKVASNKSIIGVGTAGKITGGGLTLSGVSNIIIRNITFTNASDDSINIEQGSHHIWVDHNDLSNGYDGLVDIKRGSDYVTVSWNHFHNHDKTALLGHDDGNGSQDLGHLRVTYHHNWFNGTTQRHPRVRFANPVHVYNNYYVNNGGYGVASTMNAGVLVEGNYFQGVASPIVTQTGDSDPGNIVQRNNVFSSSGTPQTRGSVVEPSSYYRYTLDSASNIPTIVRNGAGVGKLGL
jgi:pectate lyase